MKSTKNLLLTMLSIASVSAAISCSDGGKTNDILDKSKNLDGGETYTPINSAKKADLTESQLKTVRFIWQYLPKMKNYFPSFDFSGAVGCTAQGELIVEKLSSQTSFSRTASNQAEASAAHQFKISSEDCVSDFDDKVEGSLSGEALSKSTSTVNSNEVDYSKRNRGSTESFIDLTGSISVQLGEDNGEKHTIDLSNLGISFSFDSLGWEELKEIGLSDAAGLGLETKAEAYTQFVADRMGCNGKISLDDVEMACESVLKAYLDYIAQGS